MASNIDFDGFVERRKELDQLMMSNADMQKKVQGIVRDVLKAVRTNMSEEAKRAMDSDPRRAYQAVRSMVYRSILGGNVNILQGRRAGSKRAPLPPKRDWSAYVNRKGNRRGGNRTPRTQRTEDLMTYYGKDRGFILRFLNAGTASRHNGYRDTGSITATNWFGNRSHKEMEEASQKLAQYIEQLIAERLK